MLRAMETRTSQAQVTTPDGAMPVYVAEPTAAGKHPAVIVVMGRSGLNHNIARRIAGEGYIAVAPDVYRWPDNRAPRQLLGDQADAEARRREDRRGHDDARPSASRRT
jgi:dienelactone hydrolase